MTDTITLKTPATAGVPAILQIRQLGQALQERLPSNSTFRNALQNMADYQRVSRWAAAVHPGPDAPGQPDWNAAWKEIVRQGVLTVLNPGVTPMLDNLAAARRTALGITAEAQQHPGMDPDDESPKDAANRPALHPPG